jgi:peptidoglycan-N-acetylglucosamine deacetylase
MVKIPKIIQLLFHEQVWSIPNSENKIYLTFDDGPTPEVTEKVLAILKKHQIKATFFCIGKNIENHLAVFNNIIADGHAIGNHTHKHEKGWITKNNNYEKSTENCEKIIKKNTGKSPKLFRPPYGKIGLRQTKILRKNGYKIIMWDVLSMDYDVNTSPEKCYENVVKNTKNGSIIVFHDSHKASKNVLGSLEKTITTLKNKGFQFDIIH